MTYRSSREVNAADAVPATEAHGSIQWKGTDVCMDVRCPCGQAGHLDTEFAYYYQCAACGRKYEVGSNVRLYELAEDYVAYPDGPKHEPSFKVDLGMSSREGREVPIHPSVSTATREQRRTEVDLQIAAAQVRAHYAAGGGPLKITFGEPDPKTRTMAYSVTLPEVRTYKIDLTVDGETLTPGPPMSIAPFTVLTEPAKPDRLGGGEARTAYDEYLVGQRADEDLERVRLGLKRDLRPDQVRSLAGELLDLRALCDAVREYAENHHQRSDDPEFDVLCAAYEHAVGTDPRDAE
jgi:hypothetical protein